MSSSGSTRSFSMHEVVVVAATFAVLFLLSSAIAAREELIARNFESDLFTSAELIDVDAEKRLANAVRPPIVIGTGDFKTKPHDPFA